MKEALDSHRIEFPCPHCGGKLGQNVGKIKAQDNMTCRHCGRAFTVDASQFKREIASLEKALGELGKTLGRLGK